MFARLKALRRPTADEIVKRIIYVLYSHPDVKCPLPLSKVFAVGNLEILGDYDCGIAPLLLLNYRGAQVFAYRDRATRYNYGAWVKELNAVYRAAQAFQRQQRQERFADLIEEKRA